MTLKGSFPRRWRPLRILGDTIVGPAAFYVAFWARQVIPMPFTLDLLPRDRLSFFSSPNWVLVVLTQWMVLYLFAFYDPPRRAARIELFRRLLAATSLQGLILMGFYFLSSATFPRSVLVLLIPTNCLFLFAWRSVFDVLHPPRDRRVAIVGGGSAAGAMAESLLRQTDHGLHFVGFVSGPFGEQVPGSGAEESLGPIIGELSDLPSLIADGTVDDLILASELHGWQTSLIDDLASSALDNGNIWLLPGPFESLLAGTRYHWVEDNPLIEVAREAEWRVNWPLKRALDLLLAGPSIALATPLLLVAAVAIRLTSRGPVFYRQARLGYLEQPFEILKLRTMHMNAEEGDEELLTTRDDPRLTPIGYLLRRYRIDEIPQLLNVLQGRMSLVGPRPERPGFVRRFKEDVPGYAKRFAVRPGVTGLGQIHGTYYSSPETKVRYDLAYIANWSIWLDLSIMLRTIKVIFTSAGY